MSKYRPEKEEFDSRADIPKFKDCCKTCKDKKGCLQDCGKICMLGIGDCGCQTKAMEGWK